MRRQRATKSVWANAYKRRIGCVDKLSIKNAELKITEFEIHSNEFLGLRTIKWLNVTSEAISKMTNAKPTEERLVDQGNGCVLVQIKFANCLSQTSFEACKQRLLSKWQSSNTEKHASSC